MRLFLLHCVRRVFISSIAIAGGPLLAAQDEARGGFDVKTTDSRIEVAGEALDFAIPKRGYVTGVAAGSLVDKKTGFHDPGFGLDVVDFLLEPGGDAADRAQLAENMRYDVGNLFHGQREKRIIEGPQICTQAKTLAPEVIRGADFLAVKQSWNFTDAAPGRKKGSTWEQTIVVPRSARYFIAADRMTVVNDSPALAFRLDLPGHIRHSGGDTFSEIYLSYLGHIAPSEFLTDFAPDAKFNYRRDAGKVPERMIRAYRLRDPKTGRDGPWLAGMTLNPADVSEAWCHQRGYVCFIEEIGERSIKAGASFGAAYVIGYFDSIEEMNAVYDRFKGSSILTANEKAWKLTPESPAP